MTQCNPNTCQYHAVTQKVVDNLEIAVHEIVRSQAEMRENIIQLTEAVKVFQKMQERIEKLEDKLEKKNAEQDLEIRQNSKQIYLVMAVGGAVVTLINVLIPVVLSGFLN